MDDQDVAGLDSDMEEESDGSTTDYEEDVDAEVTRLKWKRETGSSKFSPPETEFADDLPRFTGETTSESTPFEILRTFLDTRIIEDILYQTNLRAQQIQQANSKVLNKWTVLQEEELWVFLALQLLMGIVKKPQIKDYWTTDELIETPIFAKNMSRNRFEDILRCLHFSDNQNPPDNRTRLWKLGSFLPCLVKNFEACINPGEYLCVDESLLTFKGRLAFKQYNPLKRSRFGIKYFALVDCETKLLVKMLVYLGKSTRVDPRAKELCGIGGATVIKLLDGFYEKNHKVILDNWFNSPKLQELMSYNKTYCLGTVRPNRKEMPKPTSKKLPKGAVESYFTDNLLYEKWSDRRQVHMLNSFVPHQMVFANSRNPINSRDKPLSITIYNRTMGGVDHIDQILAPYESQRKSIRWYMKLAFHLLDLAVYNSHVLHQYHHGTQAVAYREFLSNLIKEILIKNKSVRKKMGRPAREIEESLFQQDNSQIQHLPIKVLKQNGKPSPSDCYVCKRNGKRKTTTFKCGPCNKRLCIRGTESCYKDFHKKIGIQNSQIQEISDSSPDSQYDLESSQSQSLLASEETFYSYQ